MPSWPSALPNPIDLLIALVVVLYALHGFQQGWLVSVVELVGFAVSLVVGLAFYASVAHLLVGWTPLPYSLSKPVAFLLLWILADFVYGLAIRAVLAGQWRRRHSALDRLLGAWPGAVRGLLVATVLLTIAATIPFPEPIAGAFQTSRAGRTLQPHASVLGVQFGQVFGDAIQETIGLLTVKPESDERVTLQFKVAAPPYDSAGEDELLELLNRERTARGLAPLRVDATLRDVARAHSRDMLQRGYFAHVDLDGRSPFDRMRQGGASFRAGGENLALAPTVEVAHTGLMNSPGHRENILNPAFGRVGIGIADGGLHGKMITENFAD